MKNNYSAMTLVGLGVIGMMAYAFIAPRLLSKPKVVAEAPAVAEVPVAAAPMAVPGQLGPVGKIGNNYDNVALAEEMDMNFAGVTFAENIPGQSYGFPMAGIV